MDHKEMIADITQKLAGGRLVNVDIVYGIIPTYIFTFEDDMERVGVLHIQPSLSSNSNNLEVHAHATLNFYWHPYSKQV